MGGDGLSKPLRNVQGSGSTGSREAEQQGTPRCVWEWSGRASLRRRQFRLSSEACIGVGRAERGKKNVPGRGDRACKGPGVGGSRAVLRGEEQQVEGRAVRAGWSQ